jgi:hypothetical protein
MQHITMSFCHVYMMDHWDGPAILSKGSYSHHHINPACILYY